MERMQETEIIRRCQEGDISAFRWIYDRYGETLFHTACRMLRQQQDAEDAVQTTFVKLFRGIKKFRHDSKFSTYLFRILMNTCFDHLDRKKKMRPETLDKINPSHQPRHDLRMDLAEAMDGLPHQQKACFVLFAVEDRPQDEIADILGLSVGGVKSNIHHAKKKLRAVLTEDIETS